MELIKLAGTGMILCASLWAGLHAALGLRRTHEQLRDLIAALELISSEILFASTPFVRLCKRAGEGRCAGVRRFFEILAREGAKQEGFAPCLTRSASAEAGLILPESALLPLERLFDGFGAFDLDGQLAQLRLASAELGRLSEEFSGQLEGRCRSYTVLGLTAGAAVLVLVI